MNGRLLMVLWIALILTAPAFMGWNSSVPQTNAISLELPASELAQTEYSGVIPMDLSVMVGDSGDDLINAYNYLAAVPFVIRSNSTHTASGLLLPDDIESYASPLDDWIEVLGGSMNELVFLGDVQNADHLALTGIADSQVTISGTDHFEMAANLAQQYFVGASSVVLVEAPHLSQFSDSIELVDTVATLDAMSSRSQSGSTSSSNDWEYFGSFSPNGGGAIITRTSGDDYIWFDLLSKENGEYYSLDYPYYDGRTVMYPYEERSGDTWYLHAIDLYQYGRTVSLYFDIDVPDADFYTINVESGEDCRIDFDLSVVGGNPCDIGLNVLDPEGNIVLSGNRFALFEDVAEVSEISVSLSHPRAGQYRAYVFSAEHSQISYDLTITKQVIGEQRQAAMAAAANGATIASLLGAPLLYTSGESIDPVTLQAILALSPQTVYYVNPIGPVDTAIEEELDNLGVSVNTIEDFHQMQFRLSALDTRDNSTGSVTLYDSVGTGFAAAGLSAAQRKSIVMPFNYEDSCLMTYSQIPEQIGWLREYQMPLGASYSLINLFTTSADFSDMSPPEATMTRISTQFFAWLSENTGITSVDDVITIAPYYGPGAALPPSFERAITGKANAGRYCSIDTDATLVQIMRSILRIPLQSLSSRSNEALGSYLVYSYRDSVMANDRRYYTVDNSADFTTEMTSAGLSTTMQVGPSTVSELAGAPYAWIATIHGGIGLDLYNYDGRVALFSYNAWRAYDDGQSTSNPDADTDISPENVVNPSEAYLDLYNMSELVNGVNLRGMFALLDSCELGSSYGPSTLMERGADAVLACRTDTLAGPADLLEYNIFYRMSSLGQPLGRALDFSFDVNSHRYALSDYGIDTLVTSSDVDVVGASCLQFSIFGDPDITLYDWSSTPYPVTDRCTSIGPARAAHAYPGSTYYLPLGINDPVGNMFTLEGSFNVMVYDSTDSLLTSGTAVSTLQELGLFEIEFSSTAPLGTYDVEITDVDTSEVYYSQIILEWPNLTIESFDCTQFTNLGTWFVEVVVFNPQDVIAETVIEIRIGNEILLIADALWLPGVSTNEFELIVVFGPSGRQNLNVILTIGSHSIVCCDYESLILVNTHWVTPVMWLVVPALSVSIVLTGIYTRRKGSRLFSLQKAMNAEISGDYEEAFKSYCDFKLPKSASRIAMKEDLPEDMISKLMDVFGSAVARDLDVLANQAILKGDYDRASRIFIIIGQPGKGLTYRTLDDLHAGRIQDGVTSFREVASFENAGYAVNVLEHLKNLSEKTRSEFVINSKDTLLLLATRFRIQDSSKDLLLEVIGDNAEQEFLINILMNMGRPEQVAERIAGQKTVPSMVKITMALDQNNRNSIAPIVVLTLVSRYKPKQVAKYLTSIDVSDRSLGEAASPLVRELIQHPTDRELISSLKQISNASTAGSIPAIDDAIKAAAILVATSEEQGISMDEASGSSMIPVIASLNDQEMAENLLSKIEKELLGGSVPASSDIDALAELVYGLRLASYRTDNMLQQIKLKFSSYENTLVNRLSESYQGVIMTSKLQLSGDDWLEVSTGSIAQSIIAESPLNDKVSVVKACFRAVQRATGAVLKTYINNNIDPSELQRLVDELMNNSFTRDRILRRHMRYQINQHGQRIYAPDMNAALDEAVTEVLRKWKPQGISAIKHGTFRAAVNIAQIVMDGDYSKKELREISVVILLDSRPLYSEIKHPLQQYVQSLLKHFDRDEVVSILKDTGLPERMIDEPII